MSKIILNGIEYSNGITYQELQPIIYSTEEREIGVWTDGKPLYQKTIDFGVLPNQTTKRIAHGISDIDASCIVSIEPIASTSSYATFPRVHDTSVSNQVFWEVDSTDIICYSRNANNTAFTRCFVTLKYTKTSDTAGSGSWNTDGVPTHHYSTNEQVVGTWIDGKPLYQKTVVLNNLSVTNTQWAKTNESATNIETIVDGFLNDNQSPSQTFQCDIGVDGGKVAVLTWFVGNSARTMSYLTFRYTKTTD